MEESSATEFLLLSCNGRILVVRLGGLALALIWFCDTDYD